MIGLGASKISEVLAPPREETAVEARPKAKSDACMLELSVTGKQCAEAYDMIHCFLST